MNDLSNFEDGVGTLLQKVGQTAEVAASDEWIISKAKGSGNAKLSSGIYKLRDNMRIKIKLVADKMFLIKFMEVYYL